MTEFVEKGSVDEIVSEVLRSLIDSGMKGAADTVASDEAFATRIFVGSNGKMPPDGTLWLISLGKAQRVW